MKKDRSKANGPNNQICPNTLPQKVINPKRNIICSPNPRSTSMRVCTTYLREWIAIAFISKPNDTIQAGYIYLILQKLRSDSDYSTKLNIDNILLRRNAGGYDHFLPSDSKMDNIRTLS